MAGVRGELLDADELAELEAVEGEAGVGDHAHPRGHDAAEQTTKAALL